MATKFGQTTVFALAFALGFGSSAFAQSSPDTTDPTIEESGDTHKFDDPDRLVQTLSTAEDLAALEEAEGDQAQAEGELATALGETAALLSLPPADLEETKSQLDGVITAQETKVEELTGALDGVLEEGVELSEQISTKQAEQASLDPTSAEFAQLSDEIEDLVELQEAETDLMNLEAAEETLTDKETALADATEALNDPALQETAGVIAFVESLSPEQLFSFNRAFNNARASGLDVSFITTEDLALLGDLDDVTKQDINAFTKAFESQVKFEGLAEKTGNERFLAKADSQKRKFLGKAGIELPEDDTAAAAARGAAKQSAKGAAKGAAKSAAKKAAKVAAKSAAKGAAKGAAKHAAKGAAKNAGKHAGKEAGKKAGKVAGKNAGKNKNS